MKEQLAQVVCISVFLLLKGYIFKNVFSIDEIRKPNLDQLLQRKSDPFYKERKNYHQITEKLIVLRFKYGHLQRCYFFQSLVFFEK